MVCGVARPPVRTLHILTISGFRVHVNVWLIPAAVYLERSTGNADFVLRKFRHDGEANACAARNPETFELPFYQAAVRDTSFLRICVGLLAHNYRHFSQELHN
jgi:hypothetical protein